MSNIFIQNAVLHKLVSTVNKKISLQIKLTYWLETKRYILEQIDGVYWRDVLEAGLPVRKSQTIVKKELDLQNERHGVYSLPEEWKDVVLGTRRRAPPPGKEDGDASTPYEEATRYEQRRKHLVTRLQQRQELQRRPARYKQLQSLWKSLAISQRDYTTQPRHS